MSALEEAISQLKDGRPLEAEALVARAAQEAQEHHGADSPQHAAAQFALAQVLVALGDFARGEKALRQAATVDPKQDREARKQQLTYQLNLGSVLYRMGRSDEARQVLEEGLRGRADFYGAGTEGYAFGQEALAEVLLSQGTLEKAEELAEQALAALWNARNRRAVQLVALRAAVRAARYGGERPLLEPLDGLPLELKAELVHSCLDRAEHDRPPVSLEVLQELRERLEELGDETAPLLPPLFAGIANVAGAAQNHGPRIEALGWLRDSFLKKDDRAQAALVWQAIALAWVEAQDAAKADEAFRQAIETSQGQPAPLRSQILRTQGMSLSQRKRDAEADAALCEAVKIAEAGDAREALGQALVARGIFTQHAGRRDEAKAMLERALPLLPAAHPDTLFARNHLDALQNKHDCGCSDMRRALSQTLGELVRGKLPEGLLTSIAVGSVEDMRLEVGLARAPTPEEKELLDRVIHQAVAQLREQIRRQGQLPLKPA